MKYPDLRLIIDKFNQTHNTGAADWQKTIDFHYLFIREPWLMSNWQTLDEMTLSLTEIVRQFVHVAIS